MSVFLSALTMSPIANSCLFKDGDQIIVLGDSITEQGDQHPNGFVKLLRSKVLLKNTQIKITSSGVSGDKVIDLKKRLDSGILNIKPSTVILFIGVNDILHQKYSNLTESSPENFRETFKDILSKIHSTGAKVVVCTLACIGEKIIWTKKDWELRNSYWPWRRSPQYGDGQLSNMLDQYSDIIRQIAGEFDLVIVDLQREFKKYLIANNKNNEYFGILTRDGVHMNDKGNQLIADLIADSLSLHACQ